MNKNINRSKFKSTSTRKAILEAFSYSNNPLDVRGILMILKKKNLIVMDKATIYRNLSSFVERGILKKIDLRKDSMFFELNSKNHHHHMICTACGLIEDFSSGKFEKLIEDVVEKSSKFSRIKEHSLELFGLCKKCFL